jgi:hypothetical protein
MVKLKLTGALLLLLAYSCGPAGKNQNISFEENSDRVQIVMFHLAQRCESCDAVETETKAILEGEYKSELDSGKIRFLTYEINSDDGRKLAERLRASGQGLFIVKGDSIADLTVPAFFFASTDPGRYHDSLTKELGKYFR